jgi:hypothetical protein
MADEKKDPGNAPPAPPKEKQAQPPTENPKSKIKPRPILESEEKRRKRQ